MKKLALLCSLFVPLAVQATTLTNVPMQGGMVMPMISYNAMMGHLMVMMPTNVPDLIPLLVSNPADNFAPADPWYQDLDPSKEGQSFSRRYGFVMDVMSDPLPANTAIWIRKLSGSPEVSAFRYSGNPPQAWEPVFGTAGTSNALYWNGMMFHPAFSAPPGTSTYTATFEAYLVNTLTTQEVAGSSSSTMLFKWNNVDDGRPDLDVGIKFAVVWPTNITNYVVEYAPSMSATNWTTVTNVPAVVDGQNAVYLGTEQAGQFFRMRKSP